MSDSQVYRWVQQQIKAGEDTASIIKQLVGRGYDKKVAMHIVESAYDEYLRASPAQAGSTPSMFLPIVGGLFAAVVGGALWATMALSTQSDMGFAAWAIGGICGLVVLLLGKGQKGIPLQLTAAICSVLGILIGKYGIFFFTIRGDTAERLGEQAAGALSLFSPEVMEAFVEYLPASFESYDLMWVALAVLTAWGIPRATTALPILQQDETSNHDPGQSDGSGKTQRS